MRFQDVDAAHKTGDEIILATIKTELHILREKNTFLTFKIF